MKKPKSIDELIDASSLGTPEVKAIRTEADPAVVARILQRADDLALADKLLGEVQELLAGRFGEQSADGYLEETRLAIAFALRSAYQRGKTIGYGTAGSRAARDWVPVGKRLPDKETSVLTWSQCNTWGYRIAWYTSDGCWDWDGPILDRVTHWMPLPGPP